MLENLLSFPVALPLFAEPQIDDQGFEVDSQGLLHQRLYTWSHFREGNLTDGFTREAYDAAGFARLDSGRDTCVACVGLQMIRGKVCFWISSYRLGFDHVTYPTISSSRTRNREGTIAAN